MSSDIEIMAGLGRPFTLGMLYDARREILIPGFSLFDEETLKTYSSTSSQRSSEFQIIASDSIESKSTMLGIGASLGCSILGGLVEVSGSANYLTDVKKYINQSRVTLKYKATTIYKQFTAPPGTVVAQQTAITENGLATHVVTGILYGANAFFIFDSQKLDSSQVHEVKGRMDTLINLIPLVEIEGSTSIKLSFEDRSLANNLSCKFHGDFFLESLPTTFDDAVNTYQKLPGLLGEDGTDAIPIKVWLVPLKKFCSSVDPLIYEITVSGVRKIHTILQELCKLKRRCQEAETDNLVRKFPAMYDRINTFQHLFHDYTITVKQMIAKEIPLIRAGTVKEGALEEITVGRAKSPFSNESVSKWLDATEREIHMMQACVSGVEGTSIKFVPNQTELDAEILAANATHVMCLVFTSLGCSDSYLSAMSDALESANSESTKYVPPSTDDLWCYSNEVVMSTKMKADTFCMLARNMKDRRNVRFLTTAIANPKYQGATVYYYKEGRLESEDFTFTAIPSVEDVKDRRDLLWYACDVTFDPYTVSDSIGLSDDNRYAESGNHQKYDANPMRFDGSQTVLCKEMLTGCHYWEVEWTGYTHAGVTYVSIGRKGITDDCIVGHNPRSWALGHDPTRGYRVKHNKESIDVTVPSPVFKRLGMYLDLCGGTLSYYIVSGNELHHIYTFRDTFTEPVYPVFEIGWDADHGTVRIL